MALDPSGLASLGAPRQRSVARFPWHVAVLVLSICAIGVWNLASASRSSHDQVWVTQATWMGIGLVAALAVVLVDPRLFRRGAWVLYGLVLLFLVLVLLRGRVIMGARRWLTFGPVNFQPSEVAKIAVILVLARWFSSERESDPRRGPRGLAGIALPSLLVVVPAVLVQRQPDLGTALIILAVGATMILFAGVRWKTLVVLGLAGALAGAAAWPHLKPYQRKRVETFLNPEGDVLGAGYHATQSMIAVGSGQVFGKGWGQGTQTLLSFLPEQHTDFIFSVWAEEHGFAGTLLLLALYFALVGSGITIALEARDRFGQFVAVGATALIFWHAFVNMGMVTGVLPVVGVTLPLMSYGGTSVVIVLSAVAMLASVGTKRFAN
ncbi:MAG TPA: rod shape-determining protein RodA [Anaeromyxobacteraceae bacterium]|nr:rod shape-determining protein RodA [Anaeromyxobacteraceae bacterium]